MFKKKSNSLTLLHEPEIDYLLELLYERKIQIGCRSWEEEQESAEYQLNANIRVKLEELSRKKVR